MGKRLNKRIMGGERDGEEKTGKKIIKEKDKEQSIVKGWEGKSVLSESEAGEGGKRDKRFA